jgi:Ser-tRNA(Ala) deacylase AlaX
LRMRSMVGIMRRHMLARTQGDGEMYPRIDMEAFRFAVLHKTEEEESALMDRGRTWDEAVLDRDEVRYIEDGSDDNMKKVTPSDRTRRHVECAMEFYMDVCACFCVIN